MRGVIEPAQAGNSTDLDALGRDGDGAADRRKGCGMTDREDGEAQVVGFGEHVCRERGCLQVVADRDTGQTCLAETSNELRLSVSRCRQAHPGGQQ